MSGMGWLVGTAVKKKWEKKRETKCAQLELMIDPSHIPHCGGPKTAVSVAVL